MNIINRRSTLFQTITDPHIKFITSFHIIINNFHHLIFSWDFLAWLLHSYSVILFHDYIRNILMSLTACNFTHRHILKIRSRLNKNFLGMCYSDNGLVAIVTSPHIRFKYSTKYQ